MKKKRIGINPDGSPHYEFELTQAEHDAGNVLFVTGPIAKVLTMPDGTEYDTVETAIPVKREHVGHLHIAIHKAHHAEGRFLEHPVPALEDVALPDTD